MQLLTNIIIISLIAFSITFYLYGKLSQRVSDQNKAYEESTKYYKSVLAQEGRKAAIIAQASFDRSARNSISLLKQAHDKSYKTNKADTPN